MTVILNVLSIVLLFSAFAVVHSYLASLQVKKKLIAKYPGIGAFYRLFYNLFALLSFLLIYWVSPEIDITLFDLDYPLDLIIIGLQALSLLGLVWSAYYMDLKEFTGLKQIGRYLKGKYNPETLDGIVELNTSGPYKYSRHPLYLFTILFLIFRPAMDLAYFTFLVCFIAYFYIGAYFEEKKLVQTIGTGYERYRERVPSIFPFRFNK